MVVKGRNTVGICVSIDLFEPLAADGIAQHMHAPCAQDRASKKMWLACRDGRHDFLVAVDVAGRGFKSNKLRANIIQNKWLLQMHLLVRLVLDNHNNEAARIALSGNLM